MRAISSTPPPNDDVFSTNDVARAAGVPLQRVADLLIDSQVTTFQNLMSTTDAVRLVRALRGLRPASDLARSPLTLPSQTRRRGGWSILASTTLHAGILVALLFAASLGWLNANETEQIVKDSPPLHLVYLVTLGPGGGGGGGGLQMPEPPAPIERKAPPKPVRRLSSPVPRVVRTPPPPRPVAPPRPLPPVQVTIDPPKVPVPKAEPIVHAPAQAVQAPVVAPPTNSAEKSGVLDAASASTSSGGPGRDGGVGAGAGTGTGEGRGAGLGPGSGGGAGGGPFHPGTGIDPPTLLREVKPIYTDEARKRAVEGDVVLEIVVRRDGTVGTTRVTRGLGAGLDERAVEAVRQWHFGPARRQGAPVDVVVEVSVEFKLR